MILEKEIEIVLNSANISYYEKLGYDVPKHLNSSSKLVVKRGTSIIVKVSDLLKGSKVRITRICDICKEKRKIIYKDLKTHNNSEDLCKNCGTKYIAAKKQRLNILHIKSHFIKNKLKPLFKIYKNNKQKLKYRCMKCGYNGKINFNSLQNNRGCNGLCKNERLRKGKLGKNNPMFGCREENSPNWNSNLRKEDRIRTRYRIREWRKSVYERDNYTCQCCYQQGGILNAHHLNGYHWAIDERYDINNGITLCKVCHSKFHKEYGRKNNTIEQFSEFINEKNTI